MKLYCQHTALHRDGKLELHPTLIEIEKHKIKKVTLWDRPLNELPEKTSKLQNKMLTPAFINMHTHLAMSFFRYQDISQTASGNMVKDYYFQLEKKLSPEDVRAFTRMGAYESLCFGVGTVWDHYYHGESVAQALCDVGLTGVVAPTLQDLEGPAKDVWEREWSHTESIRQSKTFKENHVHAALGPHATDTVSSQLWEKIQKMSSDENIPIHFHLAQSQDEFYKRLSMENLTPTEFLLHKGLFDTKNSLIMAHGIYLRESDLKILSQHRNSHLVYCPFSQMIFEFPASVLQWEEHGLNWLIGTDTVGSNDSMNIQKELRAISGTPMQKLTFSETYKQFMAYPFKQQSLEELSSERHLLFQSTQKFRDPSFLLSKVWHQAGQRHPHLKTGSIEENYLANFIVWDLEHPTFWPSQTLRGLCFNDSHSAIYNMLIAGKWVSEDGSFLEGLRNSPPYLEALKEAKGRLKKLMPSAKS